MAISTAQIIKKIGCDKLALCKGEGYWYFVYDDLEANGIYEDESVCSFKLNQLSLELWVEIGKDFVARAEKLNK